MAMVVVIMINPSIMAAVGSQLATHPSLFATAYRIIKFACFAYYTNICHSSDTVQHRAMWTDNLRQYSSSLQYLHGTTSFYLFYCAMQYLLSTVTTDDPFDLLSAFSSLLLNRDRLAHLF